MVGRGASQARPRRHLLARFQTSRLALLRLPPSSSSALPPVATSPPPARFSPLPQLPTSSAPPPALLALIHPSIHQTSAERQGPLRPWCEARGWGEEQNKALEDSDKSLAWCWLLPSPPAHLLLNRGPRPSTSTRLSFLSADSGRPQAVSPAQASHVLLGSTGLRQAAGCRQHALQPIPGMENPEPRSQPQERCRVVWSGQSTGEPRRHPKWSSRPLQRQKDPAGPHPTPDKWVGGSLPTTCEE